MRGTARLRRKILARSARVAVVGQGYVGLSLSCAAASTGFPVVGLDVDPDRIADLSRGLMSVPGVREVDFEAGRASGNLRFTSDTDALDGADVAIVCVPTPVRDHTPDLSFVEGACKEVAAHLSPGSMVILESTTYPGTTEQIVLPILQSSGLDASRDFLLAYSPERIDPGNDEFHFRNTPRVVGGLTPEAGGAAGMFYAQLVDRVVLVSSAQAAELAKLLENTYRHVNIALVNEMAMLCHDVGIDIWEVVEAASSKPFGFMPFHPGPGVGGHCIPLDPTYLAWQVRRDAGRQFRILEEAQDINAQMPAYVATRIGDALNERGLAVKGSNVLVLGVSYKPDVGDTRESPSLGVMAQLIRRGARVGYHDPYVRSVELAGGPLARTELTRRAVEAADCVALLTPHHAYDLAWLSQHATLVFDSRNAFAGRRATNVVTL